MLPIPRKLLSSLFELDRDVRFAKDEKIELGEEGARNKLALSF